MRALLHAKVFSWPFCRRRIGVEQLILSWCGATRDGPCEGDRTCMHRDRVRGNMGKQHVSCACTCTSHAHAHVHMYMCMCMRCACACTRYMLLPHVPAHTVPVHARAVTLTRAVARSSAPR